MLVSSTCGIVTQCSKTRRGVTMCNTLHNASRIVTHIAICVTVTILMLSSSYSAKNKIHNYLMADINSTVTLYCDDDTTESNTTESNTKESNNYYWKLFTPKNECIIYKFIKEFKINTINESIVTDRDDNVDDVVTMYNVTQSNNTTHATTHVTTMQQTVLSYKINDRITIFENNSLKITNMTFDDAGFYCCINNDTKTPVALIGITVIDVEIQDDINPNGTIVNDRRFLDDTCYNNATNCIILQI